MRNSWPHSRIGGWLCLFVTALSSALFAEPVTDYNVAIDFYKKQRWQLAAETCEEFLTKYPDHERAPTARLYLAQSLVHLRKFAEARQQFRLFLQNADGHADRALAVYRIGECSFLIGDYQAAKEDLQAFLRQYQDHDLAEWAILYLGETYLRLNDYPRATQMFELSLRRYPQGRLIDDVEFGLAKSLEAAGNREGAVAVYQRAAERAGNPRAAESLFNVGAKFFDDEKFADAAATFQQIPERFPQSSLAPLAALNAGYARFRSDQFSEAIEQFEKAAQDPTQQAAARFWIGLSQKALGNYAEASRTFATSWQSQPDQPYGERLTLQWGDSELRQGNPEQAVDLFLRVVSRWPQGELADDALHAAGEAALKAGKIDQALELHEQFARTFPTSPLKLVDDLLFARILIAKGDAASATEAPALYEQAATILAQVLSRSNLDQTKRFARLQLARAYERLKRDDDVIRELDGLLAADKELTPEERFDALLVRGNARLRAGQFESAGSDYAQAVSLAASPEHQRIALAGEAAAWSQTRDWDKVRNALKQLAPLDPADTQFGRSAVAAGDAAFEVRDWGTAGEFFSLVTARHPPGQYRLPALSGLAHTQYERNEFADAAKTFEELQLHSTEDPVLNSHAAYMHAVALRQAGDLNGALAAYQGMIHRFRKVSLPAAEQQQAITLNLSRSAKGGARVARELNERQTADALYEVAFQQTKKLPPGDDAELDKLINEWADLSYNAKDYQRSDELYSLLVKECPDSPLADDAKLILAESLRFGGKIEESRQAFEELANSTASDNFVQQRALVHLLDLATERSDWTSVLQLSDRLSTQHPDSAQTNYAAYRRGEALLQTRKYEEAAAELQALKEKLTITTQTPPAWWLETWLLLAEAQLALKDYPGVEATVADLRTRAPEAPNLYRADLVLGRSFDNRALFDEARAAYTRVIESKTGQGTETAAEAQFRIAESFLKQKNPAAALKAYYKVYVGYDAPRFKAAALFQAATCDLALKNQAEAVESYKTLISEFPESEYAAQARLRLQELGSPSAARQPETP
ncbi:tetratricopeptide repeat protein [Planctomicrobium sp. SH664]|uniref:tetratricopeptide repeat protein n=1 Tax=Planctomicrobium sp. SH664 TaxID=3448125 RepID=UPI003F5B7CED